MNLDDIRAHIRRTDARLTAAEQAAKQRGKQAKRERKFEKRQRPVIEALEDVAAGFVRAQELTETHKLKQRVGKLQRQAAGYAEYEATDGAAALREAADLHQRNQRRNDEAIEVHKAADRETRWRLERARIMAERSRLRREAEDSGGTVGFLDPGPLPTAAPSWFEAQPDGMRVTVHKPSVPQPEYHADGTVTLHSQNDLIGGGHPGPRLKTAEEIFQEEARR